VGIVITHNTRLFTVVTISLFHANKRWGWGTGAWHDSECSTTVELVLTATANGPTPSVPSPIHSVHLYSWPEHAAADQPAATAGRSDDASSDGSVIDPVTSDSAATYNKTPATAQPYGFLQYRSAAAATKCASTDSTGDSAKAQQKGDQDYQSRYQCRSRRWREG